MRKELDLHLRWQELRTNARGYIYWQVLTSEIVVPPAELAVLLCDVWDTHWSRAAVERLEAMLPRMAAVVEAARAQGATIIHAPSDTMSYYEATPARRRMLEAPPVQPPAPAEHPDPALPIHNSDGGSDTGERPVGSCAHYMVWTRQHPAIRINQERDGITESGHEVYNLLQQRGIKHLAIMGLHTNCCVLGRSFGIKQMVRWGVPMLLVRDLTDALYNPASPPYVSHDEGTRLAVEYIEKFWCPTISSDDLTHSTGEIPPSACEEAHMLGGSE